MIAFEVPAIILLCGVKCSFVNHASKCAQECARAKDRWMGVIVECGQATVVAGCMDVTDSGTTTWHSLKF